MTGKKKDKGGKANKGTPTIENRKARHDYLISETFEAGVALKGMEVKSIRDSKIVLKDSFAKLINGEIWLVGCHINPYKNRNSFEDCDPMRTRKLLLNKREIKKLESATKEKGLSIVPLKAYFSRRRVKILIGIAKGKKLYDKREDLKRKDAKREVERALKGE